MKKILTIFATFIVLAVFSQVPEKISYQAVIRNASNILVTNQSVGIKISILQGTATGTSVYSETHSVTTNANGLVSLQIGGGTIVSGTFSSIDWANGPYFIKTETDPNGGSSYTITGTSQLLSVPYALYAKTAGSSTPGPQGASGLNTLVNTTTEPAGANCANGGTKIEFGLDVNSNGVLETSEINSSLTKYVCNGVNTAGSVGGSNTNHGMVILNNIGTLTNWSVPSGVYYLEIWVNGSIGGNGGSATNSPYSFAGGSPGTYGSARVVLNVQPNDIISYYIGQNGQNGQNRSYVLNVPDTYGERGYSGETSYINLNGLRGMNILGSSGGNGGHAGCCGGGSIGVQGGPGVLDMTNIEQNGFFAQSASNPYSNQKQTIIIRY